MSDNDIVVNGVTYTVDALLELPNDAFEALKAGAYCRLRYYQNCAERSGRRTDKRIYDTMTIIYQRLCACAKARKQNRQQLVEALFVQCAKRHLPEATFNAIIAEAKELADDHSRSQGTEETARAAAR